jgi:hypothetical protein
MRDRGAFWSPAPDWQSAAIIGREWRAETVADARPLHLVSGNLRAFVLSHGDGAVLGPCQVCALSRYRLRLGPDRLLQIGDGEPRLAEGWFAEGFAVTDMSDGLIVVDVVGDSAPSIMAQGASFDFMSSPGRQQESANMVFAGIRLAVSRRTNGWRLHVERPMASALWRWLNVAHEHFGERAST